MSSKNALLTWLKSSQQGSRCGATIGRYAFIGAGAVVRGDAPDYALMLGVPARQRGWMSRHGIVWRSRMGMV